MKGVVTLVGAGPGNRGLLTLAGLDALQHADVVVYDRLVSADIRALIPEHALQINVGKTAGTHPIPQEDIERILVQHAREGKRVVRLKGGDNYLFGRGGEEAETLVLNGIPFCVIPGLTSAIAAPAYAGIPVTHRDFASSVHIITAHPKQGGTLEIDFDRLVKLGGTLVFLMGVSALPNLMAGLLAAGMDAHMPAAVVENGSRSCQRKQVATVGTLAEAAEAARIQSPAVIIVGEVCALSDRLDWFGALPLHGKRILVTRPKARAGTLAARLLALGADVVEVPCIEVVQRQDCTIPQPLAAYAWVVLTSPSGVDALWQYAERQNGDIRLFAHLKFACVGTATAAALLGRGIRADVIPAVQDGAHLAQALVQTVPADARLLLLRAASPNPALTDTLQEARLAFDDVAVYETRLLDTMDADTADALQARPADWVTFTSASTVHGFIRCAGDVPLEHTQVMCIGEETAKAAKAYGLTPRVAARATIEDMIAGILEVEV